MVPTDAWQPLYENTIAQVKKGDIAPTRIDDAVRRILRVKFRSGLFNKPSPKNRALSGKTHLIGALEHREVAKQAVRESLVLLKNKANILPLRADQHILIAGDGADNIGKQAGGWTITWQGTNNFNKDFPGGSSIYSGIAEKVKSAGGKVTLSVDGQFTTKPDVAIVVFGEEPYAEGVGDIENLTYQQGIKHDLALLKRLKAEGIKVVSLFISGRPMWVNAELNASDAFVALWLPGSEGSAIADVLFRQEDGTVNHDFVGKLSFSWPAHASQTQVNRFDKDYRPLLPYGFGLRYGDVNVLADDLSVDDETKTTSLQSITLFESAIKAPWKMVISDDDSTSAMTSSTIENNAVYLRTIDKEVQEDARRVIFNGTEQGQVAFIGKFPADLTQYAQANSTLEFTVRLNEPRRVSEPKPVYVSMACGKDCRGNVNISKTLASLTVDKWHTLNIDLQCFEQKGSTMSNIISPFILSSNTPLNIDFSDIYIKSPSTDAINISCI
jgi:beta-glucosidase